MPVVSGKNETSRILHDNSVIENPDSRMGGGEVIGVCAKVYQSFTQTKELGIIFHPEYIRAF